MITALLTLATASLSGMAAIAIVNALTLSRLKGRPTPPLTAPKVSLLIPARNEAAVIGRTVESLLAQEYPNYEVIILDDNSTDDTASVAGQAGRQDPRLRIVPGEPLPSGWLGKNWACHQLARLATGDILLFTDADVRWTSSALSSLMAEMAATQADLLTVWPTQQTISWAERLTVPLVALVVGSYLPLPLVHHTPWPAFAAANGQCLAFRRNAYKKIGGHTTVRGEVLEDVVLARHVKAAGLRLRMADGAGLIGCRMYRDWAGVRDGFAKNILAGYGGRVSLLLLATLFHWLVFLLPWLWLALGWRVGPASLWPAWPLALVGLGAGVRALTAAMTRQRLRDALLMPLSVLLMTRIAAQAIWWEWRYGGPLWKGRLIPHTPQTAQTPHG